MFFHFHYQPYLSPSIFIANFSLPFLNSMILFFRSAVFIQKFFLPPVMLTCTKIQIFLEKVKGAFTVKFEKIALSSA